MPAMRYQLLSDNATGIFAIWNLTPALLIRNTDAVDHDVFWYIAMSVPWPFGVYLAQKVYTPETWGYQWQVNMIMGGCPSVIKWRIDRPLENCNRDVVLGDKGCPEHPEWGSTGSTFRMLQVVYNETTPP